MTHSDFSETRVQPHSAVVAGAQTKVLSPVPLFCTVNGELYQLWRDVYSLYGEYRKVPEYNPESGYKIV